MINEKIQKQIDYISRRCKEIQPIVVIRSITYNHGPYIKDALEGFLIQKTNFPFVAVVHDDASTDGTVNILKEYAEKYPDIIFPIFEEENQYSKHDGSISEIIKKAIEVSGAKYVAICEGDDYWTDPYKLQKQVDFLENHADYSMCFHSVLRLYFQNESKKNKFSIDKVELRDYDKNEVQLKYSIPTCSAVLKKECLSECPISNKFYVGDQVIWAQASKIGKLFGMEDIMGVYRITSTGWTKNHSASKEKERTSKMMWIAHRKEMIRLFPHLDKEIFENLIKGDMAEYTSLSLTIGKLNFSTFKKFYNEYKSEYLKKVIKIFIIKILIKSRFPISKLFF